MGSENGAFHTLLHLGSAYQEKRATGRRERLLQNPFVWDVGDSVGLDAAHTDCVGAAALAGWAQKGGCVRSLSGG